MTIIDLERIHPLFIPISGFLIALVFCFLIYPGVQSSYHAVLDPDEYGVLGINLLHGHGLAYASDQGSTVYRGPLYPAFIASVLWFGNNWYPGSIWIAQCLLHGLTCLFVYLLAKKLVNRRRAIVIGFCCAAYPVMFWFAPRMWNEMLLMFLMVCLLYAALRFFEKPTILRSICIGVITGLMCLTKATFLVFVVALPLLFLLLCPVKKAGYALLMAFAALIIILPWTVRNYILVKRIIPVHTGAGFNIKVGNAIARSYFSDPLAYSVLWDKNIDQIRSLTAGLSSNRPLRDIQEEDIFMASALNELRGDFGLFTKRIVVNGLNFWYIGETRLKSIVLIILKLPILVLSVLSIFAGLKMGEKRIWIFLIIMFAYWVVHFAFAANGRLSVPVMPLAMLLALSSWRKGFRNETAVTI
ncbi:MAG: glycosyltransferase family 39 protein [bacterium]